MGLVIVTKPAVEPVSLDDLRTQCRIVATDFDSQLTSLGIAARIKAETICRRALVTQTWDLWLDRFPTYWQDWNSWTGRRTWSRSSRRLSTDAYRDITIRLEMPPVQSVTYVKYIDPATFATLSVDLTTLNMDLADEPARMAPSVGNYWPTANYQPNAVQVRFVCGYGADGTYVPETIKAAIRMMVEYWFYNPTATGENDIPSAARSLLSSEGWGSYMTG